MEGEGGNKDKWETRASDGLVDFLFMVSGRLMANLFPVLENAQEKG